MVKRRRKNVLWHLVSSLWRHARGYRKWVLIYGAMSLIGCAIALAGPLVMAQLMNAAQRLSGAELEHKAWVLLGLYALLGLGFWGFHGPSRVIENSIAFLVKGHFQVSILEKVTALPTRWHRDHHSGQTIDQVARASQALGEFAENGYEILHLLVRYVGSVLMLTWFMPVAGLAIGVVSGVVVLTIVIFDRTLIRQYEELNLAYNRVAAAVQDYLTNIATVISLRLEARIVREVRERIAAIYPQYRRNIVTNELKWFTASRLVDGSRTLLLLVLVVSMARSRGGIEVGTVYAVSEYLREIGDTFFQFTWKYGVIVTEGTRLAGVDHIEQAFDAGVRDSAKAGLPDDWRSLHIRNLDFRHNEGSSAGVAVQDLKLQRGRSYALVGESGSGKSTLLGVLRGLHAASSEVLCDGVALPYGLAHVNHQATLIPQDPEIFSDTIRFNVTMGLDASSERIMRSLRNARFDRVLDRLPAGLETNIAEKGVSLSGGERQRLALARGLFFEEEIASGLVLLDEPTSSVDAANERFIYENLLAECKDRCVLSALHKFHLLDLFDEVLVFASGRLVERGTVAQLRQAGGEFARLSRAGAGGELLVVR